MKAIILFFFIFTFTSCSKVDLKADLDPGIYINGLDFGGWCRLNNPNGNPVKIDTSTTVLHHHKNLKN